MQVQVQMKPVYGKPSFSGKETFPLKLDLGGGSVFLGTVKLFPDLFIKESFRIKETFRLRVIGGTHLTCTGTLRRQAVQGQI